MPTPFGGGIGTLVLSNGQGSWKPIGKNKFAYTYRKILYDANGVPFGLSRANGAVMLNNDVTKIQADVAIQFTDGQVTGRRIEVEEQ